MRWETNLVDETGLGQEAGARWASHAAPGGKGSRRGAGAFGEIEARLCSASITISIGPARPVPKGNGRLAA